MKKIFITGTDTHCGKTYVTLQLLKYFQRQQKKAYAIKPIATGLCEGVNEDLELLKLHNPHQAKQFCLNAFLFEAPISPHLAAKAEKKEIRSADLIAFYQKQNFAQQFDYLLIEGAGGLCVPLNQQETWIDFLKLDHFEVILTVGMRLGCLNHALLTAEMLRLHQIACLGWVANCLDPRMQAVEENITTLTSKLEMPLLAKLSYNAEFCDIIKPFL